MLFFLDIETTGLCDKEDYMLEIACVAFDGTNILDSVAQVIDPGIGKPWADRMNDYVLDMHTKNGLLDDIDECDGSAIEYAEEEIVDFVKSFPAGPGKPIIAGNSIQFDRRFIRSHMPDLDGILHHRMFDCSTLKMFAATNWPGLVQARNAEPAHRALLDCLESIETYKHYVERFNPRRFIAKARRIFDPYL